MPSCRKQAATSANEAESSVAASPVADGDGTLTLRQQALARLQQMGAPGATSDFDPLGLQEMQLRQAELEIRNEQLQRARDDSEAALTRYSDLHDRSPVGYLVLTAGGQIAQINRAGALLLGGSRETLLGQPLAQYVERMDRPALRGFLQQVRVHGGNVAMELALGADAGCMRVVHLDGEAGPDASGCWITLTDITEHRLSTNALRRSETRLRSAYRQLAQAQEAERLRLTEQLHDQVGRNLTALGLNLSILSQELAPSAAKPVAERLQDSIELLQGTVAQVRGLMCELYPPMLGDYGLHAALRWWTGEVAKRSGMAIMMHDGDTGLRLPTEVESALFRVAQEAIENAVRHSSATRVEVGLQVLERRLQMGISDDGSGFDADAVLADDERSSWGITWMRERAVAVGASLRIDSVPGSGTHVLVELPSGSW